MVGLAITRTTLLILGQSLLTRATTHGIDKATRVNRGIVSPLMINIRRRQVLISKPAPFPTSGPDGRSADHVAAKAVDIAPGLLRLQFAAAVFMSLIDRVHVRCLVFIGVLGGSAVGRFNGVVAGHA
ncbi:uncharacterized protein FRV6_10231 [Fusarium oxysporum]|uniref:Secreted protein n=1 Tax=Fusarium oxysporum TaxID=5507 RepID=A0A2H3TBI5_FUSOX|nr:uncharacterized protein FRV6_10231 [Fusarium oxysporum]